MKKVIIVVAVMLLSRVAAAEEGWVCLSDSMDAWVSNGNWEFKNGVIHRIGKGGGLNTKKLYENFVLEFEWKISEKGNSGVKYRMKKFGNKMLGIEYQIIDDEGAPAAASPLHKSGAIYDMVPATADKPLNPPGQWNKARIVARGSKLEHWLNGVKVAEIDQTTKDWETRFARSKYRKAKGFGFGKGCLHLQDHGSEVWFRNIRVKEL